MTIGIYGHGVIGKNLKKLFEVLTIEYCIFDDYDDAYNQLEKLCLCEIIFLCAERYDILQNMQNKLEMYNIEQNNIRYYQGVYFYEETQNLIQTIWSSSNDFIAFIKNDSQKSDCLKSKLQDVSKEYHRILNEAKLNYARIQNELYSKNEDIFTELYKTSKIEVKFKWYPFFANQILNNANDPFGFREKIIWDREFYRESELICVFGDSQTYGVTVGDNDTIPKQLERKLKTIKGRNFTVLNLSINASTLTHQMQLFILLAEKLKPKIVVSLFGFDLVNSFFMCEKLLSDNHLHYFHYIEKEIKGFYKSNIPLLGEAKMVNKYIKDEAIIQSLVFRLNQFSRIVQSLGIPFFAYLEPSLVLKKVWHEKEREKYNNWLIESASPDYGYIMQKIPFLIDFLDRSLAEQKYLKHYDNLNFLIENCKDALFDDYIHLNAKGNNILTDYIARNLNV
ncbi:MAG: SGNH/GDSL hydrolase family protein [Campylobacterales bacterium]|nr:SGNH/GDSL hydrolase family protein [Campylobacterales bacterium]